MSLVVSELFGTGEIDQDFYNKNVTRIFGVFGTQVIATALVAPGIPLINQQHPDDPFLIVAKKHAYLEGMDFVKIFCDYHYPVIIKGQGNDNYIKIHFKIGSSSIKVLKDLDGVVIGDVNDPDSDFGASMDISTVDIDVEMPVPHPGDPNLWLALSNPKHVNSVPIFGLPAYTVQYMGCEASLWSLPNYYRVIHHFSAGQIVVDNNQIIDRRYVGKWDYNINQVVHPITGQPYDVKIPTILKKYRLYPAADLSVLLV